MAAPPEHRPGERVFALLLLAFAGAALWQSWRISGFDGLAKPGVFPMLASATMVVAGAFILRDTRAQRGGEVGWRSFQASVLPRRIVVTVALVAAYVAAMPWTGFLLGSGVFLFVAIAYLWRRNLAVTTLVTAAALGAIYLVFRIAFQVVLPEGAWPQMLG